MNLREEKKLWKKGYRFVIGLDESGRGSLAGPVTAAAVGIREFSIFNFQFSKELKGIKDSKQLSSQRREQLFKIISQHPQIHWAVASVFPKTIDKINIKNGAELAMARAVQKLEHRPDFLIIDGGHLKNYKLKTTNYELVIKADERVFSCICASIIAKVTRDRKMFRYHKKYPQYGFNRHKGYPTKYHKHQLKKHGLSVIHRRTFKPCRDLLK